MTKHRIAAAIAATVLACTASVAGGAAALAAPTPTCSPDQSRVCTVEPKGISILIVIAGSGVKITVTSGSGEFDVGTLVQVFVFSNPVLLGTVTADSKGAATLTFTLPDSLQPGQHHIELQGTLRGVANTVSVPFTIVAPTVTGTGGLPRTGSSNILPLTESGLGLVLVGGLVLVMVRRRRGSDALAA